MGNTYPLKEKIKSFGARFNGHLKIWEIEFTEQAWSNISNLCLSTGGGIIEVPSSGENSDRSNEDGILKPNSALSKKIEALPAEVKKQIGQIPKSLDVRNHNNRLPARISSSTEGISVTELMNITAKRITESFPTPIWVIGEIQNSNSRGQSIYLSLADGVEGSSAAATLTVNAVIWQSTYQLLKKKHTEKILTEIFQDGLKIRILANVNLYKQRGQINLNIRDIDPNYTRGELALNREKLVKELKQKGLFDANKKRSLCEFPFKVGMISALGSRAESDFVHQLKSGGFCGEIIYLPAAMQGENVISEVPKAIDKLNKSECDLIVLTRGGGSAADLRWFDSREVSFAIAQSKIPIISAIGHHDDQSVAEDVSFAKEKTPTAAAQFIIDLFLEASSRIEELASLIASNLERSIDIFYDKQSGLAEKIELVAISKVNQYSENLNGIFHRFDLQLNENFQQLATCLNSHAFKLASCSLDQTNKVDQNLSLSRQLLESAVIEYLNKLDIELLKQESTLDKLNPEPWIRKGWTQIYARGNKVDTILSLRKGDQIDLRLIDGLIKTTIEKIEKR